MIKPPTVLVIFAAIAAVMLLRLLVWMGVRRLAADPFIRRGFPRARTGIALVVLAAAYFGALFGGLIQPLVEAAEVLRIDHAVNEFFAPWRKDPILLYVFLWITVLGAGPALTAVAATASGFLWIGDRVRVIAPLWVAFVGAQTTTWIGKYAIGRDRPNFFEAVTAASPSFPSGHATGSLAMFGFLAYLLARDLPRPRARLEIVFWTALLIALIGFSRIFLSLHYLTDVIGGFLVGAFWLIAGIALAERARRAPPPPSYFTQA